MATKSRSELSDHTWSLLRYRNHLLERHNERAGAKHPLAPGRPKGSASEYDHSKRQHVSPLGGVAVEGGKGKR